MVCLIKVSKYKTKTKETKELEKFNISSIKHFINGV